MQMDGRTWQDKIKNCWISDNHGRTEKSLKILEETFFPLSGQKKIVITHMLPIPEFLCRKKLDEQKPDWSYFNAFLGSRQYETLYQRYDVKYAICGHVHYRKKCPEKIIHSICAGA